MSEKPVVSPSYERLRSGGYASASSLDLIAVGFARREEDISEEAARDFLKYLGRIQALSELTPIELRELTGLDGFEAIRAMALIELGRRSGWAGKGTVQSIEGPEDVVELFGYLRNEKREHFCAVLLDNKNQVLRTATIHIGTVNASIVGPREVFREAIREGATSIIVVHNHPSGDPTPSPEDREVTDLLKFVGQKVDIPVLDHVIIGYGEAFSFSRGGTFPCLGRVS